MAKQHLLLSLAILFMVSSQAQCLLHGSGAQSQPPSVMGAHIHGKGDLMFSYVATHMEMNGVQRGTEPLSEKQVANRYMMYGTTMQMPMHMIMAMYGISNKLNVMVMGHYMSCNMTMVHAMGSFREEMMSSVNGLGDTRITGIYDLWSSSTQHALLQGGISLPTGNY